MTEDIPDKENIAMTENLKVIDGVVLTVPNRHYEGCGKPPELKAEGCYTAYFENDYGEQMVFQYDYTTKKGTLWHGDYSWDSPVEVMGGGTTLVMGEEDRAWLQLVWRVATKRETKEFHARSILTLVNAHKAIYDGLLTRPEFAGKDEQRAFLKIKRKLEKQAKALTGELIATQIDEGGK